MATQKYKVCATGRPGFEVFESETAYGAALAYQAKHPLNDGGVSTSLCGEPFAQVTVWSASALNRPTHTWSTSEMITDECRSIEMLLLAKNEKYGDSALNPARLFSRASAEEQLLVRIDDKLSRIRSSAAGEDEDVVLDLIGYLVLLRIARRRASK